MNTQEAAQALGTSATEVEGLAKIGILASRKVDGERQFEEGEVQAFLASRTRYEERMGDIVRTSVALGGYDLRFRDGLRGWLRIPDGVRGWLGLRS
jgi:hypothetical protein